MKPDFHQEIEDALNRAKLIPWIIGILGIVFGLLLVSSICFAQDLPDNERLANAIYKAEHSIKYPYGIKSINTHGDKVLARRICINTIKHAKKDFKGGDFIVFLGSRYCPTTIPAEYYLNKNWISNVRKFYERG